MIASGRWHLAGTPVVYCADHPATALLEKLVHIDLEDMPRGYTLLRIDVPDEPSHRIEVAELPADWMTNFEATQAVETDALAAAEHLLIWVPSVLAPHTWNALLNPRHEAASHCKIIETEQNLFDPRLVR